MGGMQNMRVTENQFSDQLSAFAISVEGTSLYVLRAIEETVDTLEAQERLALAIAQNGDLLTSVIRQRKPDVGKMLDPDDKVINELAGAYHGLEQRLPKMLLSKAAIDHDRELDDHHCELLHSAYDSYIAAFAALIESAKSLRAAVISHDLEAEPRNQQTFELSEVLSDLKNSQSA